MVCPNCGAPLPDTVSMCYSCRMVFKPVNHPVQQQMVSATPTVVNAPPVQIKKPIEWPEKQDFIFPIATWVTMFVGCFFPFVTVVNSKTNEVYKGYFFENAWVMIFLIAACFGYFALMFGHKRLGKYVWQIVIIIASNFIRISFGGHMLRAYDESPNKQFEQFTLTNYYYLYNLFYFVLLLCSCYFIDKYIIRPKKKSK